MLYMEKAKEKWCAALAVFVCGFMAHGYFFTNKISYHDDSCYYFGVGMTFGSGRWALGLIQKVMNKVGFLNYSSSWWNGGLCILLTAVCAVLLVELLQIRQKSYAVLLGALFIAFPAMASLFAYMFTACLLYPFDTADEADKVGRVGRRASQHKKIKALLLLDAQHNDIKPLKIRLFYYT